jgi:guanine deaminase
MNTDSVYLKRAVEKAAEGIRSGGGPFGAVISRNGEIISEAYNKVVVSHDPTAHAEVAAIRSASSFLKTHDLSDCILYSSCEPCPMCLGAIYWAGIKKVVYSCDRTDAEQAGFSDKFIYNEISLDPAERKILFLRVPDEGGKEIFKMWEESENKIPY